MMNKAKWSMPDGVYTALVTPFKDDEIDRDAWRVLVQRQVDAGVAGVVPVGCTGEAAVLARPEREWLVRTTVELAAGKCAVVAGSGSNSTALTLDATRDVLEWGADAAMLITPFYNKPQQHGLVAHYAKVARAVDIPIVLYNVPGRTACNILPATAAELSAEANIVALKEASGDLRQVEEAVDTTGLKVFSGEDGQNFQIFGLGGRGCISVVSNLLPRGMVRLWESWQSGDVTRAWWLSRTLDPVCRACFCEVNPVPVKYLLSKAGLCGPLPRLPLAAASESAAERLDRFHDEVLGDLLKEEDAL